MQIQPTAPNPISEVDWIGCLRSDPIRFDLESTLFCVLVVELTEVELVRVGSPPNKIQFQLRCDEDLAPRAVT